MKAVFIDEENTVYPGMPTTICCRLLRRCERTKKRRRSECPDAYQVNMNISLMQKED